MISCIQESKDYHIENAKRYFFLMVLIKLKQISDYFPYFLLIEKLIIIKKSCFSVKM